jgi:2-polyprenyl-3-methyl-5-hydroxy-6-metoxy-1,4-benzoquinol methylase
MASMIHYSNCPVCGSAEIKKALIVKDFTVSKQEFAIYECDQCSFRFTQDIPDADSIGAYYKSEEYISHTDTSKGIVNNLYQKVRKYTLRQKRKLVETITGVQKGQILDVGSGTGAFANEMSSHGWQVTGLEPDADAREVAKKNYDLELKETSLFYNLQPGSYDVITMWHVLEHVHDLAAYIQQLKSLLKENGKLFIAVPNYTSGDAATYKEFWAAYDVPRHLYHFSPDSMRVLTGKYGMRIEQYLPMWFDSYYICMLSNKYKSGSTGLVKAIVNGSLSNLKAAGNPKKCSSVIYVIAK